MPKKLSSIPKMLRPNRAWRRGSMQQTDPHRVEELKLEVPDPRVKSSGHRKKTADKWNQ